MDDEQEQFTRRMLRRAGLKKDSDNVSNFNSLRRKLNILRAIDVNNSRNEQINETAEIEKKIEKNARKENKTRSKKNVNNVSKKNNCVTSTSWSKIPSSFIESINSSAVKSAENPNNLTIDEFFKKNQFLEQKEENSFDPVKFDKFENENLSLKSESSKNNSNLQKLGNDHETSVEWEGTVKQCINNFFENMTKSSKIVEEVNKIVSNENLLSPKSNFLQTMIAPNDDFLPKTNLENYPISKNDSTTLKLDSVSKSEFFSPKSEFSPNNENLKGNFQLSKNVPSPKSEFFSPKMEIPPVEFMSPFSENTDYFSLQNNTDFSKNDTPKFISNDNQYLKIDPNGELKENILEIDDSMNEFSLTSFVKGLSSEEEYSNKNNNDDWNDATDFFKSTEELPELLKVTCKMIPENENCENIFDVKVSTLPAAESISKNLERLNETQSENESFNLSLIINDLDEEIKNLEIRPEARRLEKMIDSSKKFFPLKILQKNNFTPRKLFHHSIVEENDSLKIEKGEKLTDSESKEKLNEEKIGEFIEEKNLELSEEKILELGTENISDLCEENNAELNKENTSDLSKEKNAEFNEEKNSESTEKNLESINEKNMELIGENSELIGETTEEREEKRSMKEMELIEEEEEKKKIDSPLNESEKSKSKLKKKWKLIRRRTSEIKYEESIENESKETKNESKETKNESKETKNCSLENSNFLRRNSSFFRFKTPITRRQKANLESTRKISNVDLTKKTHSPSHVESMISSINPNSPATPEENKKSQRISDCSITFEIEKFLEEALGEELYSTSMTYGFNNTKEKNSNLDATELMSGDRTSLNSWLLNSKSENRQFSRHSTLNRTIGACKSLSKRIKKKFRPSLKETMRHVWNPIIPMNGEINEKLQPLIQEVSIQQTRIYQACKALDYCRSMKIFQESREQIESERLLLLATLKKQSLFKEIKIISSGIKNETIYTQQGEIIIENFALTLKEEFIKSEKQNDLVEWFVIVVSQGLTVWSTQAIPCPNDITKIIIPGSIAIKNLNPDFKILVRVFSTKFLNFLNGEKLHVKEDRDTLCPSPTKLLKRTERSASLRSHEVKFSGIRETSFILTGYVELQVHDLTLFAPWPLMSVPKNSVLHNSIDLSIKCKLDINVHHSGFLNYGGEMGGFAVWNRRWCVLEKHMLMFWNYPREQEEKPPIITINLMECVNDEVSTINRTQCARPRTFFIEISRQRNKDDRNSGVMECRLGSTIVKHLLQCDSLHDLMEWRAKLNNILAVFREWNVKGHSCPIESV